jgi:NDP-sugar pyrophosphorylase family protein
MIGTLDLYDLKHTMAGQYLQAFACPWQALAGIKDLILTLGPTLGEDYIEFYPQVWVHKSANISHTAHLGAPCIIGANTEVRHCAFIRGSALVGENCVVGNSVELKNVILFDGVQVPHFNYVGDSILGYMSHMGAGAVTSNVKSDKTPVTVKNGEEKIGTGLKKFGAMLGDYVEVGCNSVLNPGTVVGKNSNIYPTSCVRGVVPANSIWKTGGVIVKKEANHG